MTATIPSELEEQGYVFENTSKEYKVEKVDSYVQKFEDLPEEDLKKIMNQAKDMVEANLKTGKLSTSFYKGNELAGTMERFDSISELQLEKSYFCHMKDGITSLWETKNKMYITYSFNVTGMHTTRMHKVKLYHKTLFLNFSSFIFLSQNYSHYC